MSSFRAYSSKRKKYEWYILTSKREGFTSNKCKKEREMYTLVVYVYRIVNIVYTPYSSFSSKWVFILGLLAEMRVRRSCILFIRLYCDCQAQRLQWDASFDLLIVRSFFSLVLSFFVSYTQRINLNWYDEEKNKSLTGQICLCLLTNAIINIQLFKTIIIYSH